MKMKFHSLTKLQRTIGQNTVNQNGDAKTTHQKIVSKLFFASVTFNLLKTTRFSKFLIVSVLLSNEQNKTYIMYDAQILRVFEM